MWEWKLLTPRRIIAGIEWGVAHWGVMICMPDWADLMSLQPSGWTECRNTAPWCADPPGDSYFLLLCHRMCFKTRNLMYIEIRTAFVGIEPFLGKIPFWWVAKLVEKLRPAKTKSLKMVPFGVFAIKLLCWIQLFRFGKWFVLFFKVFPFLLLLGRKKCLWTRFSSQKLI